MDIQYKRLSDITPYERNPRKNDSAVKYVANSIKEFGFKVPIIIDKDGVIVAGHTRYKAAIKLKMKEVPCIIADDLSEEQVKAFRLADNKVAEKAEWDFILMTEELEDILKIDMSDFGFDLEVENSSYDIPNSEKEELLDKLGDIHIAYANAGICMMGDDVDVPYETWKKTMEVNLDGIYLCAMAAKEIMLEKGHGGSIVMTSSLSGFNANNAYGNPTPVCAYGTSKAGVYELSRFMAASLAGNGIRVNCVSPGYIWSGIHEGVMDKEGHDMLLMPVPIKKFGLNEDIASAVLFLSTDAAKYITGTVIHVDGGYSVF